MIPRTISNEIDRMFMLIFLVFGGYGRHQSLCSQSPLALRLTKVPPKLMPWQNREMWSPQMSE